MATGHCRPSEVCVPIDTHLLVKVLPVVLRHQPKQGQEGPAESVEARVAVIRVSASLHTPVPFWTLTADEKGNQRSEYVQHVTKAHHSRTLGSVLCNT